MVTDQVPCYTELSEGQIRILHLAPGHTTDELHGRLEIVDIRESGEYTALSYAWGARTLDKKLFLSTPLSITTTLWSALRRLRSETEILRVWADAICINQAHGQEKASQVMVMRQIFQNAAIVVADLGEESDGSETLSPKLANLPDRKALSKCRAGQYLPVNIDLGDEQTGRALVKLLERKWFERCWIFQEVIVASDIEIMCGDWRHSWDQLRFLAMASNVDEEDGYASSSNSDTVRVQGRIQQMNSMRAMIIRGEQIAFTTALFHNRYSKASDPRDHIYAILGLCVLEREAQLQVEYTEDYPDTFLRCGRYLVQQGLALQLLYLSHQSMQRDDLPSWLCNWSKTPDEDESYKTGLFAPGYPVFSAGTSRMPSIKLHRQHAIEAEGVLSARVEAIGSNSTVARHIVTSRDTCVAVSAMGELNMHKYLDLRESSCSEEEDDEGEDELDANNLSTFTSDSSNGQNTTSAGNRNHLRGIRRLLEYVGAATVRGPASFSIGNPKVVDGEQPTDPNLSSILLCKAGGLVGHVPRGTVVGDAIVVLHGSQLPMVLRPVGDSWKFVGSAFIPNLMSGKALEDSGVAAMDFLIV